MEGAPQLPTDAVACFRGTAGAQPGRGAFTRVTPLFREQTWGQGGPSVLGSVPTGGPPLPSFPQPGVTPGVQGVGGSDPRPVEPPQPGMWLGPRPCGHCGHHATEGRPRVLCLVSGSRGPAPCRSDSRRGSPGGGRVRGGRCAGRALDGERGQGSAQRAGDQLLAALLPSAKGREPSAAPGRGEGGRKPGAAGWVRLVTWVQAPGQDLQPRRLGSPTPPGSWPRSPEEGEGRRAATGAQAPAQAGRAGQSGDKGRMCSGPCAPLSGPALA